MLKFILLMTCLCISSIAFGQDIPAEALPPEWLGGVLVWLKTIPTVGPYIVSILGWIATIVTIFTTLSIAAQAILKSLEIPLRWSGASQIADAIKKFHDKVMPWLKYLSGFNVQKK